MRRIPTLGLLALLASPGTRAAAQGCPSAAARESTSIRLQALVDSLTRAHPSIPGISLAVIGPGDCWRFAGTAGVANRTTGEHLTPAHTHRIASNTKTYVAAAALRLIEERRLSLDDPITRHVSTRHLDALRRDGYDVAKITVRHLLTHTAGIYDYAMDERFMAATQAKPSHRWTRTEQVDSAVVWGAPYGAPGATYHYTDTGYILLAEIIERISGLALAPALRSLLDFERHGLHETWLETLEPVPPRAGPRAHQYLGALDTWGFDASVDLYGGGGLLATPMDMARFTRALLRGEVYTSTSTLETMLTTMGSSGPPRVYAAGIARVPIGREQGWGHSGFWNTFSYHIPGRDITIAASITQQDGAVTRALLMGVADVLFK